MVSEKHLSTKYNQEGFSFNIKSHGGRAITGVIGLEKKEAL